MRLSQTALSPEFCVINNDEWHSVQVACTSCQPLAIIRFEVSLVASCATGKLTAKTAVNPNKIVVRINFFFIFSGCLHRNSMARVVQIASWIPARYNHGLRTPQVVHRSCPNFIVSRFWELNPGFKALPR